MQLKVCENKNGSIAVVKMKEIIPIEYQASKWVREEVAGLKTFDAPQTTNGIKIVDNVKTMCGVWVRDAIGYFGNNANSVCDNAQLVALFTTPWTRGNGISITIKNFMKVCALFTARECIFNTWVNHTDEYSAPNVNHPDYQQWNNDAIIYTLFNSKSNQTSLRNIQYKGKTYQIKNEFFFMSNKEMRDLADIYDFRDMVSDIRGDDEDRYVYKLLQTIKLSYEANEVLKSARQLVIDTMEQRKSLHHGHEEEYNLQSWDAGYRQLKLVWKDKALPNGCVDGFMKFREMYKMLEDRLRDDVYEFGFLNR